VRCEQGCAQRWAWKAAFLGGREAWRGVGGGGFVGDLRGGKELS
jgi:hypothetical protein